MRKGCKSTLTWKIKKLTLYWKDWHKKHVDTWVWNMFPRFPGCTSTCFDFKRFPCNFPDPFRCFTFIASRCDLSRAPEWVFAKWIIKFRQLEADSLCVHIDHFDRPVFLPQFQRFASRGGVGASLFCSHVNYSWAHDTEDYSAPILRNKSIATPYVFVRIRKAPVSLWPDFISASD